MNQPKMSPEFKVGIFVIAGCAILIWMSMQVGKFKMFGGGKTYSVSVYFDNVQGLDKGGSVQISGVTVGRVKNIVLENDKAKVVLELGENIILKKDTVATIRTKGVLGEKYVELQPGLSEETIPKAEGTVVNVKKATDMDKLISDIDAAMEDIKEVTKNLRSTFGTKEGEQMMKGILENIYELTGNINNMVKKNDEGISNTVKNLEKFSAILAEKTPEISNELKEIAQSLNELIKENRSDVKKSIENIKVASEKLDKTLDSLRSISEKIDKGEGTLGKLVNDDSVHENLNKTLAGVNKMLSKNDTIRTYFEFKSEYLQRLQDARTQVNLKIYPKADYFYMLGGVDSPYGKLSRKTTTTTTSGVTTVKKEETEKERSVLINAQIGKRFYDVEFRGGLFESTGGFALDYYAFNDKWKFSTELYDFDNEYAPHWKAGASFNMLKYLFLTGGVDDIVSDRHRRSVFIGAGIKFEDEDIKYLLSSAPLPTK